MQQKFGYGVVVEFERTTLYTYIHIFMSAGDMLSEENVVSIPNKVYF